MFAAVDNRSEAQAGRHDRRFGELLRFWRTAFNLSQEALAERADISVRHLSFLENGRTRPSAVVVGKLGGGLGLGEREKAVLALAAGCAPASGGPRADEVAVSSPSAPDEWRLILGSAEPVPTSIMTRFGRVLAVNRGWLALHRAHLGNLADAESLNALDLLLHPRGWRRFVKDWALIASAMLAIIKQEATLENDAEALRNVSRWANTPGLPANWAETGARLSAGVSGYSYTLATEGENGPLYRIVHSTLGYSAADQARALILQSAYLQEDRPHFGSTDRLRHPLCPF